MTFTPTTGAEPAHDPLLTPDNHELFEHVRLRLVVRPPITWEQIAEEFAIDDVNALIRWFLEYRVPKMPTILPKTEGFTFVRDRSLRLELDRLRNREKELLTMATEAPAQLDRVQRRIANLERHG